MNIFTHRFFIGTIICGLGLVCTATGVLSFLPPANNVIIGGLAFLIGIFASRFGYIYAKAAPKQSHKVTVETLREAHLMQESHTQTVHNKNKRT